MGTRSTNFEVRRRQGILINVVEVDRGSVTQSQHRAAMSVVFKSRGGEAAGFAEKHDIPVATMHGIGGTAQIDRVRHAANGNVAVVRGDGVAATGDGHPIPDGHGITGNSGVDGAGGVSGGDPEAGVRCASVN